MEYTEQRPIQQWPIGKVGDSADLGEIVGLELYSSEMDITYQEDDDREAIVIATFVSPDDEINVYKLPFDPVLFSQLSEIFRNYALKHINNLGTPAQEYRATKTKYGYEFDLT